MRRMRTKCNGIHNIKLTSPLSTASSQRSACAWKGMSVAVSPAGAARCGAAIGGRAAAKRRCNAKRPPPLALLRTIAASSAAVRPHGEAPHCGPHVCRASTTRTQRASSLDAAYCARRWTRRPTAASVVGFQVAPAAPAVCGDALAKTARATSRWSSRRTTVHLPGSLNDNI